MHTLTHCVHPLQITTSKSHHTTNIQIPKSLSSSSSQIPNSNKISPKIPQSKAMKRQANFQNLDLNFDATELRLGLPQSDQEQQDQPQSESTKRSKFGSNSSTDPSSDDGDSDELLITHRAPAKSQVVGWPPVRSYRKNVIIESEKKKEISGMLKVSVDGAPYLRKIDLKLYHSYQQLLDVLENMFNFKLGRYSEGEGYNGCEYVPTYEDKDGDWMMVGDVPWDMFISSCKRLRMMKGSDAEDWVVYNNLLKKKN